MKSVKFVCLAVCSVMCLIAALTWATLAPAQTFERGEIRGTVYDQQHSPVPKAKVILSNASTGYKRETKSDDTGGYIFIDVPPGTYELRAEAENLAPIIIKDITVNVGASLGLDVTLPVKGQATTVMVTAAAAPVDTSTAGINQIINQRNLQDLPLSGRDYRDLAELSSSAQVVPGLRGGIRLGGQQSDYLGFVIDGQDSFNNFFGEILGSLETKNFTIPLEAVQEFQVVTNGFAPEFGRATGGLVNVVTKSGTNEIHGEAHEYYRGGSLTENDAIGLPPNINNQNQFGGSVGFPIRKDRQFLFVSADVQREDGPLVTQFCPPSTTPGAQAACLAALPMATGPMFANCAPGTCAPGTVPLPSNIPAGAALLPPGCGTPKAGDLVLKDCYGQSSLAGFQGPSTQFQRLFTILGHYDYQFSPANHFSLRSYFTRNHTNGFSGGVGQNEIPMAFDGTENFINKGATAAFALTTVLGKKVNELRLNLQGEVRERHPNSTSPMITISDSSLSDLTVGSFLNFGIGQRYFLPINGDNHKLQAGDNFTYTFGKHDVKFGGDVDVFEDRKDSFVGWSAGEYDFTSISNFNSGSNLAFSQGVALNNQPFCFKCPSTTLFPAYLPSVGLYLQDKWQVTPKFTLTYGLRWDGTWYPQPQTPLVGNKVLVGQGSGTHVAAVPQRVPADLQQFGPRIGIAWNVRGSERPTVVRAAWGLYYAQAVGIFLPTAGAGKITHCVFGCGLPDNGMVGYPYIAPTSIPNGVNQLCGTAFGCPPASDGGGYVDPAFRNPRVSSLTAGVEQTLARNLTLTVTYAFVHSWHLRTGGYSTEEAWERNYVIAGTDAFGRSILDGMTCYSGGVLGGFGAPCFDTSFFPTPLDPTLKNGDAGTNETASFGHGNYHSLVVNVTKRFSNHFQVFGNYIWSQNKDNAASERDTDTYFGAQDPVNLAIDYGRNGLDITHQFKAAGVYEFPMGFIFSSSLIAHSGVPFPLYVNTDINGDGVANLGHNNDRPTFTSGGRTFLLGRYPFNQPDFIEWDARLQKDFRITERYRAILSADFFNLTNRSNLYSNPDTNGTINYTGNCTARTGPPAGGTGLVAGPIGFNCTPLTALPKFGVNGLHNINQVAPGSTPFAFQAGVKFTF